MFKGITKRWMLNTLSVIFTIIVLIVVSLIFVITYVYQSSVEQTLSSAGNELSLVFSDYESDNTTSFNSSAREYVENFDRKEQMEVIVINSSGRVIMTSTGFTPSDKTQMPDFQDAQNNSDGYAVWNGKLLSGERAMSETRIISNSNGVMLGAVRYIVSMEPVHSRILFISVLCVAGGLAIMALVFLSGLMFIRSIVKPIGELSLIAGQIAQGDFSASEKSSISTMTKSATFVTLYRIWQRICKLPNRLKTILFQEYLTN